MKTVCPARHNFDTICEKRACNVKKYKKVFYVTGFLLCLKRWFKKKITEINR